MGLRDFLENVPYVCINDKLLANRVARQMVLLYDYELKNEHSEFSMQTLDFEMPLGRIEMMFTWKYLQPADLKKGQRVEDLVYLLSLRSYKYKYNTERFDKEIYRLETKIKEDPIKEVDSLMSIESASKGIWSD